ncbi:MAG: WD40 repeat domain-containing protein [Verrucomicrobia bacterium]|nr:WD40 repeat domain-containing protein [Verrucomicrobiota bacterium]
MRSWLIALSLVPMVLLVDHGTAQELLRHHGAITGIVLNDGGMLVSSQSGILFHERGGTQPVRMFAAPGFRVQAIAQAPDRTLYVAGGLPGESATVGRFIAASQELIVSLPSSKDVAFGIAVAPDGKHVAVAHSDGSVMVASVDTLDAGNWIQSQKHTAPALAVTFSPDGSMLASCGLDGVVLVARTAEPEQKARSLDDHTAGVECLAFSPDGKWLASGSRDAKVRLHDSATGRLLRTYSGLGMESEPVAGRVVARVPSILWSTRGLFAGTSKGSLYRLSETDDGRTQISSGNIGEPITALCEAGDQLVFAAAGRLMKFDLNDQSPSSP